MARVHGISRLLFFCLLATSSVLPQVATTRLEGTVTDEGASAIQCCYAAKERRESSALTNMVESVEEQKYDILQRQRTHRRGEDLLKPQPPGGQSRLHGRCPDLASEFPRPVRPDEVVIAANQL